MTRRLWRWWPLGATVLTVLTLVELALTVALVWRDLGPWAGVAFGLAMLGPAWGLVLGWRGLADHHGRCRREGA